MEATRDRYKTERLRFELALRMIGHEARTQTISLCTGLSHDRIRKIYSRYFPAGRGGVRRRRGKSPRQTVPFVRNAVHQLEATTLTYLFDGSMVHRDSLGSVQTIEPGAVNWMTAGRGVAHTERSGDRSTTRSMHGLQLWVALPHDAESGPASFDHQPSDAIPSADLDGARVRVIAGNGFGLHSPVPVSSPLVLAEIRLDGTAPVALDATHEERALLVLDGDVRLDRETQREPSEIIEVYRVPIARALEMARSGEMVDGHSALALLRCEPYLNGNGRR